MRFVTAVHSPSSPITQKWGYHWSIIPVSCHYPKGPMMYFHTALKSYNV